MIDLKLLEKDFENVSKRLKLKGVDENNLEEIKKLFKEKKEIKTTLDKLLEQRNILSKQIGNFMKNGEKDKAEEIKKEVNSLKEEISVLEEKLKTIEDSLLQKALVIPNIPDEDVPIGKDEDENVEIKRVGEIPTFDFEPKPHDELGEKLDWLDFTRGVKLAKSRFTVMKKDAARLERALINFFLDHNREWGFEEVYVPFMVNRETMTGTGQLPKFEEDLFKIENEELYLIPTAEVPLTNLFRDEIITNLDEPIKLTAYTPCFRKEAGSYGKDTKGIIRQHQFDKVELVAITKPEDSDKMFDEMVACASNALEKLGLPYRQLMLCTGDLGFSAAKTIDLEVWIPSQNKYREISSVSNTRDFQARRAKIRYKDGKKNKLVHTLNGSSLAVGRTLVAIMENYQTKDGNIQIPEALKKYL
ncbi:seryl-tRNA synthetase [Nautilia profundicola AmH]|uniref:Serine--tRNA ligase n=1 Tax=Nautilia profundicola (strain ATCC BAA-1463 / DSM 18972 / AmH) TaxID=598659 RepID=SYS_NAUPA|nr:serine--tRNA ligase [Nautilia profundicola]B9L7B0.1 RecName: Full=Serine--tRNA ligase; AltName: Full=Seryl-tRNA synthetase; Short=SerRS; AltName: Full=Seryl-tRNA(Ser/Sec) synthetase [Nautilia profundicola AmH]ACM93722.1 seryl-tRNA synthetase [Nautilia profundicola AmH]